jgi:hypothetical protein
MQRTKPLPLLKIGANRRYLITADEQPFFWLGDTAWEMLHRLNKEEVRRYLADRAAKGFNVVQTVILAELDGLDSPNAYGHLPLIDKDPTQPNEAYFQFVDEVIQLAEELGIYIALLPTWGDKFNKAWGQGPEIFTVENAESYGAYLGARYQSYPNIIWVLGGDRIPSEAHHYAIIRAMAEGIKQHDRQHLMTYHPKGGQLASDWFGQDDWLDIDMFQTRHQSHFKEYKFTRKALSAKPIRPVIDGEPGYENIPNLLNKWNLKRLDDADVRKNAYWNMFAGAAGHTYGCNEIWQMVDQGRAPKFGAQFPWHEAIHLPGSRQMGLMKKLFESLSWQNLRADQTLLFPTFLANYQSILAMVSTDKNVLLVYSPRGSTFRLKLKALKVETVNAYWFDPVDGTIQEAGQYGNHKTVLFKPPTNRKGKDVVLVVMDSRASRKWVEESEMVSYSIHQEKIKNLRGKMNWEGDLEAMRIDQ